MDKLEERLRKASRTEQFLADPLYVEAMAAIDAAILEKFRECSVHDATGLQQVRMLLHVHELYKRWFKDTVADGKIAALELEQKKKPLMQRLKQVI